jgi:hypothetical protein
VDSDISEIWKPDTSTYKYVKNFLERLRSRRTVSDEEEERIEKAISRLEKLVDYPITALEVSSSVDEDQVAEIFVRINSKGTPLNQADFILTLMSVFWDAGRAELEDFCRKAKAQPSDGQPSPFNHYIKPNPDQLLRISVALGFRRAPGARVFPSSRKGPANETIFDRAAGKTVDGQIKMIIFWPLKIVHT